VLSSSGAVTASATLGGQLQLPSELDVGDLTARDIRVRGFETALADSAANTFFVGAQVDIIDTELSNMGGVFFYSMSGAQRGLYTLGVKNAEFGKAITKLGKPIGSLGHHYAIGGPGVGELVPEVWDGVPPATLQYFRPHAGTIAAFELLPSGDLFTSILIFGDNSGDKLGASVVGLGDNDLDGIPELLAGAPGGQYARVYRSDFPEALAQMQRAESGFGKQVGALGTGGSQLPEFALVASDSNLHTYRISDCVTFSVATPPEENPIPDEVQAHLDQLEGQLEELIAAGRVPALSPPVLRDLAEGLDQLAQGVGVAGALVLPLPAPPAGAEYSLAGAADQIQANAKKVRRMAKRIQNRRAKCRSTMEDSARKQCRQGLRRFVNVRVKNTLTQTLALLRSIQ
jgi:hypothetical protein